MQVLIVDDNQDITGLLTRFLKAKGIESVATNDPFDGLDKIKEAQYDMILLDISMPELSGIDIIQALETEKILKNQKIVIFSATAFTTSQINDLLKKDGIQGCLKKPIQRLSQSPFRFRFPGFWSPPARGRDPVPGETVEFHPIVLW